MLRTAAVSVFGSIALSRSASAVAAASTCVARFLSTNRVAQSRKSAVVSDIDGVLLRGDSVIPGVPDALKRLREAEIPVLFITNGGGVPEKTKAEQLSKLLDYDVHAEDVILSHSPMREIGKKHENDLVLIAGHRDEAAVAASYGFKNFKLMQQYSEENPFLWFVDTKKNLKIIGKEGARPEDFNPEPVGAIVVFTDPDSWGRDLQIMVDILRSDGVPGNVVDEQVVPIYCSNPDFVWMSEFKTPRFAQGAYTECLKMLYHKVTGKQLKVHQFGKPETSTYEYAERVIRRMMGAIHGNEEPADTIYAVGDNPASDIRGANRAGGHWRSVLVRTGCFMEGENDRTDPADVVLQDFSAAVDLILKEKEQ